MFKNATNNNVKSKKTAWELIKEIPDTPEQRKIDREIATIEKKYEETRLKKQYNKENKSLNTNEKTISKSLKIKNNRKGKKTESDTPYIEDSFGWNAGKIWNALEMYGPLNQSSIIQNTKLSLNDFFIGIGWLARENKISKDMKCYRLGNTNLTYEIGENAGKIWKLLDLKGQVDISYITQSTDMKIKDVYSAIGWLSRENKIKIINKNRQIIYKLI